MWPQNKTEGEKKKRQEKHSETLAASRPKKKASEGASELKPHEFQKIPKNARGAEWHPEKTAKKQDARPKRAKQQVRRDKKKQEPTKPLRVGVSCYYLICISLSKKTKNDVDEKTKGRENEPKKQQT